MLHLFDFSLSIELIEIVSTTITECERSAMVAWTNEKDEVYVVKGFRA